MSISAVVITAFKEAQVASPKSYIITIAEELSRQHFAAFESGENEEEFREQFEKCVLVLLSNKKTGSTADNCLHFVSSYIRVLAELVDNEYLEGIEAFINDIFKFLSQGLVTKNRNVRLMSLRMIQHSWNHTRVHDTLVPSTRTKLTNKFLELAIDVDARVRAQAIQCLGTSINESNRSTIISRLERSLEHDPSADVRKHAMIQLKGVDTLTVMNSESAYLKLLVSRARDPNATTRAHAFQTLREGKISIGEIRSLTEGLEDEVIPELYVDRILRGVRDSSSVVQKAADNLINGWVKDAGGMIDFLAQLNIIPEEDETLLLSHAKEDLMVYWFNKLGTEQVNTRKFLEETADDLATFTPEMGFYMRCFSQYCRDKKLYAFQSDFVPSLFELTEFIDAYWSKFIECASYEDEEPEREKLFCFGQLLLIASHLDLSDSASRNRLMNFLEGALSSPWSCYSTYPILMKLLRELSESNREFLDQGLAQLGLLPTDISVMAQWDAELTITQGILCNLTDVETEDDFEKLAHPALRCLGEAEHQKTALPLASDAIHILGMLGLADAKQSTFILDIMVGRYKVHFTEARQKQIEISEEIEELKGDQVDAGDDTRIDLDEEIEELASTRVMSETWEERQRILRSVTDIMEKHQTVHQGALQALREGLNESSDPELQSICAESLAKLIFCDIVESDEIISDFVGLYFDKFNTPREPRERDSYSIIRSVVEVVEYFFGLFHLLPQHALKLSEIFPSVIFSRCKGLIAEVTEQQVNRHNVDPNTTTDDFDTKRTAVSVIETHFKTFQAVISNFSHWVNPEEVRPPSKELGSHSNFIRAILVELTSIIPDVTAEKELFSTIPHKLQGAGPSGKNSTFYKVWSRYDQILFAKLKDLVLAPSFEADTLRELIDMTYKIQDCTAFSAPSRVIVNKLQTELKVMLEQREIKEEEMAMELSNSSLLRSDAPDNEAAPTEIKTEEPNALQIEPVGDTPAPEVLQQQQYELVSDIVSEPPATDPASDRSQDVVTPPRRKRKSNTPASASPKRRRK